MPNGSGGPSFAVTRSKRSMLHSSVTLIVEHHFCTSAGFSRRPRPDPDGSPLVLVGPVIDDAVTTDGSGDASLSAVGAPVLQAAAITTTAGSQARPVPRCGTLPPSQLSPASL